MANGARKGITHNELQDPEGGIWMEESGGGLNHVYQLHQPGAEAHPVILQPDHWPCMIHACIPKINSTALHG